ncbi:hypothetical protein [Streptomyces sp. NPDC001933]|uniref:hypothetical protein n=1 Tax=Streptomyces sp. NPDC001933 TaxID=3364626 RepID=UPI0036C74212
MATWHYFVELLTEALGAENVQGGTGTKDTKAVATFEQTLKLKDGTTKKRRQKLHFEYDGKDTGWIAVTSLIGPVANVDTDAFLAYLGEDWRQPAAVVVDGQLALRHHISLPAAEKDKDADAINKEVLAKAFVSSVAVGSVADFLEKHYTDEDAR